MTKATTSNEKVLAGLMVKVMQGDQGALVELAKLQGMTIPVASEVTKPEAIVTSADIENVMETFDIEKAEAKKLLADYPEASNISVGVAPATKEKPNRLLVVFDLDRIVAETKSGKETRVFCTGKGRAVKARFGDKEIKFYPGTVSMSK